MAKKGHQTEKTKIILKFIKDGLTNAEICKIVGCNQVCISTVKARNNLPVCKKNKYDWNKIQEYYDQGNSVTECQEMFGVCKASFKKAKKRGAFKPRSAKEGSIIRTKKYGGRKHSQDTKDKIREIVNNKIEKDAWHYSFSKVRTHKFISKFAGEVNVMGKWELEYAQYLDDNNIKWRRPKEKFYYEFSELKSGCGYYTPDFYLIDESIYIEIKGYETDKDRAKWEWFPKDQKHKILKYSDLKELGFVLSKK